MKILYITCANTNSLSGGSLCAKRNYDSIIDIFGKENVYQFIMSPVTEKRTFKNKLIKAIEVFKFFGGGLTSQYLKDIMALFERENFTHVFIDSSAIGIIAKHIKRRNPKITIYTFFHNVEYDYMISTTWKSGDYKHLFWIASAKRNERLACKYSSRIIVLNEKDKKRVQKLYHAKNIDIIPITLKDYCLIDKKPFRPLSSPLKALFVGSYFQGNLKGIKWFCKEIMPKINIHLTIVGTGMEKLQSQIPTSSKISVKGRVEDLTPYYLDADFVVLPIISGGGMKVKTAEALMWGKNIIGTPDALEGYNLNKEIAYTCTNSHEFIESIKTFSKKKSCKYNKIARAKYEQQFSYKVSLELYKKIFNI